MVQAAPHIPDTAPAPRRLIVHLGVQKTGSTSLHHFLQKNEAALAPRLQVLTPRRASKTRDMGRLAGLYSLDADREAEFVAAIQAVRAEIGAGPGVALVSHENLPGAMPGREVVTTLYPRLEAIVALLDRHLAPHVPHYVIYSRDMADWKRSVHNQAVRTDGYTRPLPEFLAETADAGDWAGLAARLEAAAPGRATMLRLEDEADRARLGAQLLRLAGLSDDDIAALDPLVRAQNESLNSGSLEFMRLINSLDLGPKARHMVGEVVRTHQALFVTTI